MDERDWEEREYRRYRARRKQVRKLKTILAGALALVLFCCVVIVRAHFVGKNNPEEPAAVSSAVSSSGSSDGASDRADSSADSSTGASDTADPQYIWASPKGAAGGTAEDVLYENDPSLMEGTTKIIYLTFDDGPGEYTESLLNMLAKYNVKVTFFVTNQYPEYNYLIAREAEEGHSIAVHTFCHDYKTIYASSEAYWNDFEQEQQVIEQQTGYRTELMRFPGGSSNTVSSFNPGIMTTLTQEATAKGYTYFDWNASSGDGGSQTNSASVIANSETECSYTDTSVLLCHDVKQTTVAAMEEFINWGLSNGYTFLPLSPHSFAAHHQVNN